ncbi:hypothetical protein AMIS_20120 [Actinoplanes missouriensis 431]|uniref:Uncharacterized protein n=1 Tax=Actinoplanes missouriensis (strain ATCC 14538 / DSM 43046 / CBS 188.64 / JCM 3121 / NBRC 102363 / NCIMB 12654 / NRRL B-3342 / UNCC 431) TaxID=512565 RepID=I0H2J5_ACTM4|nr:hypothetical protein [Actinoplanes missouriensis]BAL87232.1 hypothetical protein AMIS_20120 [Actinoplanes missouriensis 431]
MARVLVVSDDEATVVPIVVVGDNEDYVQGECPCGEVISDRGQFEDTVQATVIHVDQRH